MGMFSNIKGSMAAARTAMEQMQQQIQQAADGSLGASGASMSAGGQPPPPPGQYPPGQYPPSQYPPSQHPPSQFQPGQFPGQYPPGPYGGPVRTPINFAGMASSYSDFQPARSKRHPIMITLSLLCLVGGGIMLAYGIIKVVDQTSAIRSDAVAKGNVALPNSDPEVAQFTSGKAQEYSVYIDLDTSSENLRDDVVAETTCVAHVGDGHDVTMRGSRQGTSNTLGDLSSIGYFSAPEGPVSVICGQSGFGRAGSNLPFYVTPGTTNVFSGIGYILGGAGLLAASLVLAIFGFRRKYQTTTIAA